MENSEGIGRNTSFDCVVMLTWSNWWTELRSNRFHYATRFAKSTPVVFVQPDLPRGTFYYENSDFENLQILHVPSNYGRAQTLRLNEALRSQGLIAPILWIYNPCFIDFVVTTYARLKVYHATEDYFSSDMFGSPNWLQLLRELLCHADLLVAVSEGVRQSHVVHGRYTGPCLVLTNGCDFEFWMQDRPIAQMDDTPEDRRIALYSGGINQKIDFDLLRQVIARRPEWEFWFCGEAFSCFQEWKEVQRLPNVKFWGKLRPESVRDLSYQATVGIIPYIQTSYITAKSFPLKAFEYVACGLPVVSIPIQALQEFSNLFTFAANAEDFCKAMEEVRATRYDVEKIQDRRKMAETQSYSRKFGRLQEDLGKRLAARFLDEFHTNKLNILVLYDRESAKVNTIHDHLMSFSRFSRQHIYYAACTGDALADDLSWFDAVIIHYAVRVNFPIDLVGPHLISASYAQRLLRYGGFKILFIQDEYDDTEIARRWIEHFGIHAVFTCVPEPYIDHVYPKQRFPYVEFVHTLTGYVPIALEHAKASKPMSERKFLLGYRGRELPWWYGDLGREKFVIGKRMRGICESRGLPVDIEWESDKRIYGEAWFHFIEDCRAMLGTESGSNVFDETGSIRRRIEELKEKDPMVTYESIRQDILADYDGKILMNQISPKIFEVIALRTALVLFEGTYSNVIQPNVHYIPLKKDFSNIEEVFKKLQDDGFLTKMTEKAHQDIIRSGNYSYKAFMSVMDDYIGRRVKGQKVVLLSTICGYQHLDSKHVHLIHLPIETFKSSVTNIFVSPHYVLTNPDEPSHPVRSAVRFVSRFRHGSEVRVALTHLLRESLKFVAWTISKVQKREHSQLDRRMYDFCKTIWHKIVD